MSTFDVGERGEVWAVVTIAYTGDAHFEVSSGGFEWRRSLEEARAVYTAEVRAMEGSNALIRLVHFQFPTYGLQWTSAAITRLLETETDGLEGDFPALVQARLWAYS